MTQCPRGKIVPAITCSQDEVLPSWVFAYQKSSVCGICTPTHGLVEDRAICESRQERRDRFPYRHFRGIGISIGRVFRVRPGYRHSLGRAGTERLMLFVACEPRKLVTIFNDAMPADQSRLHLTGGATHSFGSKKNPTSLL